MQRGAQDYLLKSEADAAVARCARCATRASAPPSGSSLREREARFRALVEHSYDAVTLLDERTSVLYDSRSIEPRDAATHPRNGSAQPIGAICSIPDDMPACHGALRELLATSGRSRCTSSTGSGTRTAAGAGGKRSRSTG